MRLFILFLLSLLVLPYSAMGGKWFNLIIDDYRDYFGSENVVAINDWQFMYFYEGYVTRYDDLFNETTNLIQSLVYDEYVYRAVLVDIDEVDDWNFKVNVISEVVIG